MRPCQRHGGPVLPLCPCRPNQAGCGSTGQRDGGLHVVGLHIAFDVAVPAVHTLLHRAEGDAVQRAVVHGCIYKVVGVVHSLRVQAGALRALRQQVVAEGVVQFQVTREPLHHLPLLRFLFVLLFFYFIFFCRVAVLYPFHRLVVPVQAESPSGRLFCLGFPGEADGELAVAGNEEGFTLRQAGVELVEVRKQLLAGIGGSRQGCLPTRGKQVS